MLLNISAKLWRNSRPACRERSVTAQALLAVPTFLAVILPDVGFVVSLMGASLGAALILVVPAFMGRAVLGDADATPRERAAMGAVGWFGVLVGAFGTTVTVLETYTDLLK